MAREYGKDYSDWSPEALSEGGQLGEVIYPQLLEWARKVVRRKEGQSEIDYEEEVQFFADDLLEIFNEEAGSEYVEEEEEKEEKEGVEQERIPGTPEGFLRNVTQLKAPIFTRKFGPITVFNVAGVPETDRLYGIGNDEAGKFYLIEVTETEWIVQGPYDKMRDLPPEKLEQRRGERKLQRIPKARIEWRDSGWLVVWDEGSGDLRDAALEDPSSGSKWRDLDNVHDATDEDLTRGAQLVLAHHFLTADRVKIYR
jgi:hypothetical protein